MLIQLVSKQHISVSESSESNSWTVFVTSIVEVARVIFLVAAAMFENAWSYTVLGFGRFSSYELQISYTSREMYDRCVSLLVSDLVAINRLNFALENFNLIFFHPTELKLYETKQCSAGCKISQQNLAWESIWSNPKQNSGRGLRTHGACARLPIGKRCHIKINSINRSVTYTMTVKNTRNWKKQGSLLSSICLLDSCYNKADPRSKKNRLILVTQ